MRSPDPECLTLQTRVTKFSFSCKSLLIPGFLKRQLRTGLLCRKRGAGPVTKFCPKTVPELSDLLINCTRAVRSAHKLYQSYQIRSYTVQYLFFPPELHKHFLSAITSTASKVHGLPSAFSAPAVLTSYLHSCAANLCNLARRRAFPGAGRMLKGQEWGGDGEGKRNK